MQKPKKSLVVTLILLFIVKNITTYFYKEVSKDIYSTHGDYVVLKKEVSELLQFEDSVIYGNGPAKKAAIDTITSYNQLKELVADNKKDIKQKVIKLENFKERKEKLESKYTIIKASDYIVNVIIAIWFLFIIIKLTKRK